MKRIRGVFAVGRAIWNANVFNRCGQRPRGIRQTGYAECPFARRPSGQPIRSEISFFPLDGRSSTTSSRARLERVGSQAVALIAGAVTVTFQMACPFLSRYLVHSNQSEPNRRGFVSSTNQPPFHISRSRRIVYARTNAIVSLRAKTGHLRSSAPFRAKYLIRFYVLFDNSILILEIYAKNCCLYNKFCL